MFAAALAAFVTIFIAEFGDKTQLVSMSLACRYPPGKVLAGAMTALTAVVGLAVLAGGFIAASIPEKLVALISGVLFIIIGLHGYFKKEEAESECSDRNGFIQTFFLVFLAEFGDKTQLAAVLLAAGTGYPLAVFAGAMAAMFLNHLLAVYFGSKILARLKPLYLKIGTTVLFVIIGLVIITANI